MHKLLILLFLFCLSCSETEVEDIVIAAPLEKSKIVNGDFEAIIDSAGVNGSILILSDGEYQSNDFQWAEIGRLPASTFKIPNSIIALELGIMTDDSTLIVWNGEHRSQKRWEKDLLFRDAFHTSCVPCYQDIAREIGVKRMKNQLSKLNFGEMVVDSTNLDMFWLEGSSIINQYQQIEFLQNFNDQLLPISNRTYSLMSSLMIIESDDNYILRGKSGWSIENKKHNCWFVGYLKSNNRTYYFATNIEPRKDTDISDLSSIRKDVTIAALQNIGAFKKD